MPYHLDNTYWGGNGKHSDVSEVYFEELVPSKGQAETPEGEILRAINQLIYDHYNNGSCNARTDHSETLVAHTYLFDSEVTEKIELIDEAIRELDRHDIFYMGDHFSESHIEKFERAMEDVMDVVIEYIHHSSNVDVEDVNSLG